MAIDLLLRDKLKMNRMLHLRGHTGEGLAGDGSKTPTAKMDETMLLRLAEDLAIRFALDRFQRG